jgi:tetratricopeptide (TPR) repeat protein/tRNA A-37 threonylcarbamoyl transferase component Bud32
VNPERWRRLNDVFHAAAAVETGARTAFLRDACADDPALADEVARLLAAHERPGGFIEASAIPSARDWLAADGLAEGRRLGPYRIVRQIARGGMGAVYLAERADGQYQQQVAIKLIKRGMDTEQVLERFRAERQILASLDHPNIARLLDGGTTDDGQPYFAMEYIDGQPIDAYADARRLGVPDRLRLFLQVCAAVAYAHQHLVVHRDIKPLNILVTPDGLPKLLDFGIAKLLHAVPDEATSTVTGLRLLTPEYASPEQVEGRHATTVSDVYSLGVVLYELLTGRSPYRPRSRAPLDVAEAVITTEPQRPSVAAATVDAATARRLRGDLDTIVLTALRKEPARRYQSVEQLATDIQRHLEGRPVLARADTFRYRAGKFVRRNRAAVAAGVLVALALLGGTVATAWQARQARAAQARAERRFNDVRKLANTVLFDYHDAIKDLPGALPVRERLVRDALGYLDTLAQETAGDASLQRDLAVAYRRVGDIQGGTLGSNLGDTDGAIASYGKAVGILEALLGSDSTDARTRRDLASVSLALSGLKFDQGDIGASLAATGHARALLEPLATADTMGLALRLELSAVYDHLGVLLLETGDPRAAAELHRRDLQGLEAAPPDERRSARVRRALSVAHHHLADAQVQLGDLRGALESHQRSKAIRSELAAEFPDNADYQRLVGASNYYMGDILAELGRPGEALALHRSNAAGDSAGLRADPKNAALRSGLAFSLSRIGDMLVRLGRSNEALSAYRESLALRAGELRADSANLFKRVQLIESHGRICRTLGRIAPAAAGPGCATVSRLMHATQLDPTNAGYRSYFAGAYSELGVVYDSLAASPATPPAERGGYRRAALDAHRRSLIIWSDMAARGIVSPVDSARVTEAAKAVGRAQAALR